MFKYYLPQQKGLQKLLEKAFVRRFSFTQRKTSRTLKIDVFKTLVNKNIRKLPSKYELLLLY